MLTKPEPKIMERTVFSSSSQRPRQDNLNREIKGVSKLSVPKDIAKDSKPPLPGSDLGNNQVNQKKKEKEPNNAPKELNDNNNDEVNFGKGNKQIPWWNQEKDVNKLQLINS